MTLASLPQPPYVQGVSASLSQPGAVIMTPGEFDARFTGLFEHAAFRLELLDRYDSPGTQQRVQRFLAGQPDDPSARAGWDALIAGARAAAKIMSRVHVVSEPLTGYLRFELDFYRGSVAAGEDVRILPRTRAAGLDLPGFDRCSSARGHHDPWSHGSGSLRAARRLPPRSRSALNRRPCGTFRP